jgi:hypothetical protein
MMVKDVLDRPFPICGFCFCPSPLALDIIPILRFETSRIDSLTTKHQLTNIRFYVLNT